MNRLTTAAVLLAALLGTNSAFAEDRCNVPVAEWQPSEALQQKLETEGWKIKRIKSDDGCYEVYAIDPRGDRVEAYFDPRSFKMIKQKIDD
ncbi:PepSY domain-containing protein [Oceanibacterium hippocampi]|uniref:PepSY domain-containing protein n=1 Tax=Oceanibacterium hippocampi TaxID=745714 RepID=A0A1Y5TL15_9PROT|nr:PepSY domain-containing protein [Oceanibacterium hippocampi]SLN62830.1 hypothetical protein OCH7691_02797 [Oceanibacterium hippocampi]